MVKVPVTVTLDEDVVDELKQRVAAGEATSVSALVLDALRQRLRGDDLADLVAEMVGDQPLTKEELAWADEQLGR